MRKTISKLLTRCAIGVFLSMTAGFTVAVPMTLVDQGSEWRYTTLATDLWPSWGSVDYSTFDFSSAVWSGTGNAAFGNAGSFTTFWGANTDLALEQSFNLSGAASGSLTLNVASDNGFAIFLNGMEIAKDNAEGFTSYWEYTYSVSTAFLNNGLNTLQVLAEDHGGATFFDLKLSGDLTLTAVPEPGASLLLFFGLLGLTVARKRKIV